MLSSFLVVVFIADNYEAHETGAILVYDWIVFVFLIPGMMRSL